MTGKGRRVVVATCYTMGGAEGVVAELKRRGVGARVSDEGLAMRIWMGDNMNAPINFVQVDERDLERAQEILVAAEGLEFALVDPDDPDGSVPMAPGEGGGADDEGPLISEIERLVRRAMTLAILSWPIFLLGPVALWFSMRIMSRPLEDVERRRAWTAAGLSLLPTVATILWLLMPVLILIKDELTRP